MNLFKKNYFRILAFIVFPLFILGCSPKNEEQPKVTEEIKLNSGAVLKSEQGIYKLYNYQNGQYKGIDTDNLVLSYDKNSLSYIEVENGKHYVIHKEHKNEIKDEPYSGLKLSPGANYISYFIDNNGLKLKIFETDGNEEIEIKSNVSISGTLYDWYNSNTLVYYGVSSDGLNGLFTYDIKEKKEELLYKIDEGYLAFIKGSVDNILFLQLTLENDRKLMIIDKNTKKVSMLNDKIDELSDVVVHKNKVYFTGKVKGNSKSLYELNGSNVKRLIFDFPKIVNTEKGLKVDDSGKILFIGSNKLNSNEQQVYSYAEDGTISVVSKIGTDYAFLEYRN